MTITIRVDEDTKRIAETLAKQQDRSLTSLIRQLIKQEAERVGLK